MLARGPAPPRPRARTCQGAPLQAQWLRRGQRANRGFAPVNRRVTQASARPSGRKRAGRRRLRACQQAGDKRQRRARQEARRRSGKSRERGAWAAARGAWAAAGAACWRGAPDCNGGAPRRQQSPALRRNAAQRARARARPRGAWCGAAQMHQWLGRGVRGGRATAKGVEGKTRESGAPSKGLAPADTQVCKGVSQGTFYAKQTNGGAITATGSCGGSIDRGTRGVCGGGAWRGRARCATEGGAAGCGAPGGGALGRQGARCWPEGPPKGGAPCGGELRAGARAFWRGGCHQRPPALRVSRARHTGVAAGGGVHPFWGGGGAAPRSARLLRGEGGGGACAATLARPRARADARPRPGMVRRGPLDVQGPRDRRAECSGVAATPGWVGRTHKER